MLIRLIILAVVCAPSLLFAQFDGGLGGGLGPASRPRTLANTGQYSLQKPSDKILNALEQNVQFEFFDTPLQDIADFISQQFEIQVKLDVAALEEIGIAEDHAITYTIQEASLSKFFDRGLGRYDVDYVVDGPLLVLTTAGVADVSMETKVFDVGDLIIGDFDEQRLSGAIRSLTIGGQWVSLSGEGGVLQITNGQLIVVQTQRGLRAIEAFLNQLRESKEAQHQFAGKMIVVAYPLQSPETGHLGDKLTDEEETVDPFAERMAKLIPELISPDSWNEDTRIEVLPGMMVVVQTREVHSEINRFLKPIMPPEPMLPVGGGFGAGTGFGGSPAGGGFF